MRIKDYEGPIELSSRLIFSLLVISLEQKTSEIRLSERLIEMGAGLSRKEILQLHEGLSSAGKMDLIDDFFGELQLMPSARYSKYKKAMQRIADDCCVISSRHGQISAYAPFRTKPNRMYGQMSGGTTPEGDHVPNIMKDLSLNDPQEWERMRRFLLRYG